ncbi:hypothetical protein [Mesorhizobium sp. dw_380]|uniref:hypothetical protein n=1 Tax=Mesorhizobium sp. dw_380 TaxID=2812001 RepID=UPI001BDDD512|nr:hypothetical protein [Mesorhizobium sp. dw_380]
MTFITILLSVQASSRFIAYRASILLTVVRNTALCRDMHPVPAKWSSRPMLEKPADLAGRSSFTRPLATNPHLFDDTVVMAPMLDHLNVATLVSVVTPGLIAVIFVATVLSVAEITLSMMMAAKIVVVIGLGIVGLAIVRLNCNACCINRRDESRHGCKNEHGCDYEFLHDYLQSFTHYNELMA